MKRIILFLLLCMPHLATAQTQASFEELITRYQSEQDCTTVTLSRDMLAAMDVGPGIDLMQVVSIENRELGEVFMSEVEAIVAEYNVMMRVGGGGSLVKIVNRADEQGTITELVILTIDSNEYIVVRLIGEDIKLDDTSSIINL